MSTTLSNPCGTQAHSGAQRSRWIVLATSIGVVVLLLIALLMRLHTLGVQFDRDSYDEGVYWQTLRALSSGHPLYSDTFYSQPPMFILSLFPVYAIAGQTLWAARFSIAVISLLGLVGAFLLGYALRGRLGGFVALLLCISSQPYLYASQTIQAEGTQVAFSLLAIAFAYLWWRRPTGWRGSLYAALCTLTLVISIFCKLFALATVVPIALLALAHLWLIFKPSGETEDVTHWQNIQSLAVGILVLIVATIIIMLPYLGNLSAFWSGVVSFHTAAKGVNIRASNSAQIMHFLLSPLGAAALIGTIAALLKRDWLVLPLLAWLLASAYLLWQQTPLFTHHMVILVPVLVGLTIFALDERLLQSLRQSRLALKEPLAILQVLALLVILVTSGFDGRYDLSYYHTMQAKNAASSTQNALHVAQDLQRVVRPDQYVITDGQFLAALAGRNTPPSLVDTSSVRIKTGYLTAHQLIQEAQSSNVQAVLFYTGRLTQIPAFYTWVTQHYQLAHHYGKGSELWIRME
jgi:4-amino-4-deoxy-L-arabinose transferase-like glycosyltransferase